MVQLPFDLCNILVRQILEVRTLGDILPCETVGCKKQVFDQQFSEKLISADFGKLVLHVVIDKAVMRQRAAASLLGA